jgi:hypothetical protein
MLETIAAADQANTRTDKMEAYLQKLVELSGGNKEQNL